MNELDRHGGAGHEGTEHDAGGSPGKQTRTQRLPVQRRATSAAPFGASAPSELTSPDRALDPFGFHLLSASSSDEAGTSQTVSVTLARTPAAGAEGSEQAGGTAKSGAAPGGGQAADIPGEELVSNLDAIAATIPYSGSVTRGGVTLSGEFGKTSSVPNLKDIVITMGTGTITVTATYELTTKWDTLKGTGPSGQTNIASADDPALTKTNYPTAASDLTPDMSDEGGRPPRTKFWAQDLTERHEKRHATHHQDEAKKGLKLALEWLKTQTATDKSGVESLLQELQKKIVAHIIANAIGLPGELVAYGDGAPSYLARAKAIKEKGDKGDYK